ncbi:MAG: ribosome assembly RNA-binding protein YhbY [Sideroxydans sp.]|nr:ribosome assembly RNA-binding protein YhbY [Sideroxydans sp.]
MLTLTVDQRRDLKARAHPLNATVMIGSAGLTEAVLEEIARSLNSHELIKIRVMSDDRAGRAAILEQICERLNAAAVQHIGKILVVYRPSPDMPIKKPARRKGKPATKKMLGSRN